MPHKKLNYLMICSYFSRTDVGQNTKQHAPHQSRLSNSTKRSIIIEQGSDSAACPATRMHNKPAHVTRKFDSSVHCSVLRRVDQLSRITGRLLCCFVSPFALSRSASRPTIYDRPCILRDGHFLTLTPFMSTYHKQRLRWYCLRSLRSPTSANVAASLSISGLN